MDGVLTVVGLSSVLLLSRTQAEKLVQVVLRFSVVEAASRSGYMGLIAQCW